MIKENIFPNDLYQMIFKRSSFHIFTGKGGRPLNENDINGIYRAYDTFFPLFKDIKTSIRVVPEQDTTCRRGADCRILIYSEKKDGYLQNIGYLGEQLDLYLASKDIGTLWFGIGKPDKEDHDGLEYVIMIAVSKINDDGKFRKDMFKSKRKDTDEIWRGETIGGVTNIVRFAPSACNSQPWTVTNDGKILFVYRYKKEGKRGIMPKDKVSFYNRIDIGIFQLFMDICLESKRIKYTKQLFTDDDADRETVLNAIYNLQ